MPGIANSIVRECLAALSSLHRAGIVHLEVAPGGRTLLTVDTSGEVRTHRIKNGVAQRPGRVMPSPEGRAPGAGFFGDSQVLVGGADRRVRWFDPATSRPIEITGRRTSVPRVAAGVTREVRRLEFAPDGRSLFTGREIQQERATARLPAQKTTGNRVDVGKVIPVRRK